LTVIITKSKMNKKRMFAAQYCFYGCTNKLQTNKRVRAQKFSVILDYLLIVCLAHMNFWSVWKQPMLVTAICFKFILWQVGRLIFYHLGTMVRLPYTKIFLLRILLHNLTYLEMLQLQNMQT